MSVGCAFARLSFSYVVEHFLRHNKPVWIAVISEGEKDPFAVLLPENFVSYGGQILFHTISSTTRRSIANHAVTNIRQHLISECGAALRVLRLVDRVRSATDQPAPEPYSSRAPLNPATCEKMRKFAGSDPLAERTAKIRVNSTIRRAKSLFAPLVALPRGCLA